MIVFNKCFELLCAAQPSQGAMPCLNVIGLTGGTRFESFDTARQKFCLIDLRINF